MVMAPQTEKRSLVYSVVAIQLILLSTSQHWQESLYTGIEQGTFHLILTAYGADEDPDKSGMTDLVSNLLAVQSDPPLPLSLQTLRNGTPSLSLAPTKTMGSTPLWLLARQHYR